MTIVRYDVGRGGAPAIAVSDDRRRVLRRGFTPEWITLSWNVIGIGVPASAALVARSVALAGFALDSR